MTHKVSTIIIPFTDVEIKVKKCYMAQGSTSNVSFSISVWYWKGLKVLLANGY